MTRYSDKNGIPRSDTTWWRNSTRQELLPLPLTEESSRRSQLPYSAKISQTEVLRIWAASSSRSFTYKQIEKHAQVSAKTIPNEKAFRNWKKTWNGRTNASQSQNI